MLTGKPAGGKRWPRGQKFTLSAAGADARDAYRDAVVGARASGRAALDSALSAWATQRSVAPGDGVIVAELAGKRLGLSDLCQALETAGIVPDEVRAGVGRLVEAGIVDPIPLGPQVRAGS